MTRRIPGFHRTHGPHHHPAAPLAPYVNVRVGDADDIPDVDFMIDTGADFTILAPRDAVALFGRAYTAIDFAQLAGGIESISVGRAEARMIMSPMSLRFTDDAGGYLALTLPVAIVEPLPPQPGDHGNWLMPSLLGRDVLQHFDLHLSYHPPSVSLTEAALGG